jgi:hypothetical protein
LRYGVWIFWGILRRHPGGLTHLLVVVDKFTKWIEVKQVAKICSRQAMDFIQDIFFYFGMANSIITDNDTQFIREGFLEFCDDDNIHVDWADMAHPRTNG